MEPAPVQGPVLPSPVAPISAADPRAYQIAVLTGLLLYGTTVLAFDITRSRILLNLATVLLVQLACTRIFRLPRFDPWSALISGLSLCLLLRTNHLWIAVLAGVISIGSKFVVRIRGKHVFNPTNLGVAATILFTGRAWVSPGQWGSVAFFGFAMACLGGLVVYRAERSDVTWAFLVFYLGMLFGRSYLLGEPMTIPWHRMQSGAMLLFSFFMISDPKTTPDHRAGRILFASLVALGAWYVQFKLFRTNGLIWSLLFWSPFVPLIDLLLPGRPYAWARMTNPLKGPLMKTATLASLALTLSLSAAPAAEAFCGFYVAKADAKLFNKASQVVLVRDGDRTVLTMANDFSGEMREFAIVIPVPTVLERGQIHVGDKANIDHLDAYSAPRLVEYFDDDPCERRLYKMAVPPAAAAEADSAGRAERAKSLGVKIEAAYTVGEYDILILSADQSTGLEIWLREEGYRIPQGASAVLGSYLKQNMKFFVAKVNLSEQAKLGFSYLRPIQVAYESPKFMLPIRLGMVNADGPQDLFVYALTRQGRVETTNYRTVRLPSNVDVPVYVKDDFARFYKDMFSQQVKKEDMRVVFLEYAWDMAWCDPCAADPLSADELRKLGVFWVGGSDGSARKPGFAPPPPGPAQNVFLSRLHVRYDMAHFPEDLVFQETADRQNFQGRYVLRHPYTGKMDCAEAEGYRKSVWERQRREAETLASLTGWNLADIHQKMNLGSGPKRGSWWDELWK